MIDTKKRQLFYAKSTKQGWLSQVFYFVELVGALFWTHGQYENLTTDMKQSLSVSSPAEFVKIKEKQKAWAVDNGLRVHEVNQRFSCSVIHCN